MPTYYGDGIIGYSEEEVKLREKNQMAHKFNDDDKTVKEFKDSIPFGVHVVQFGGAIADTTEAGKEFIEVGVINEDGIEDSARVWFVGGASNISFNTLRQIAINQGKTEDEQGKIKGRVDAVADSEALVDVLNDVCGNGGKLWFSKYYDPKRTYKGQDGSTRQSVNKSIYGYEPKPRPELATAPGSDEITRDTVDKLFPADEKPQASNTVPEDGDWAK